jgi:hypothetical protein
MFSYQCIHYIIRVVPITIIFLLGSYSLGNIIEVNWVSMIINVEHKTKQRGHTVCQKRKKCLKTGDPTLRGSGFHVWKCETSTHHNLRKGKRESGTYPSGVRGSGLREFKYPNNNIYTKLQKVSSVSGFRGSGSTYHNSQKVKKEGGTFPSGFWGLGLREFNNQIKTHNQSQNHEE